MASSIPLSAYWLVVLIGVVVGFAGALYNFVLVFSIKLFRKISKSMPFIKFVIPFLIAGLVGIFFPLALGGGDPIIEELSLQSAFTWLILVLLVKFLFSMVSFSSGAPGGIFFPLLVMGSLVGAIIAKASITGGAISEELFFNFVALAMAGYFTAIVRAPITGIILLIEMTGSFKSLLPLTVVAVTAFVTADLLRSVPIYESLLELQLEAQGKGDFTAHSHKMITFETAVHMGSSADGKRIKELTLPSSTLIIAIRRDGIDITPNGDTQIKAMDFLVTMTNVSQEAEVKELMLRLTESD